MCVDSIYFEFFKQLELNIVLFNEFLDLSVGSCLLSSKLITRKAKNSQSFSSELFIHYYQLFIIWFSQSSFRCNVHSKKGLTSFEFWKLDYVSIDILHFDIKERFRALLGENLWLSFHPSTKFSKIYEGTKYLHYIR